MTSPNNPNNPSSEDRGRTGSYQERGPSGNQPAEDSGSQALSESLRSSFAIVKIIVVLLIAFFIGSLIFTVPPQENAVVLRLGKPGKVLDPGYHWRWPFIDKVVRIQSGSVKEVESNVGWYATGPQGQPRPMRPTLDPASDGYTLTKDGNILHVKMTMQYRITEPKQYAFHFSDATNILQNFLNNALFAASARYSVVDAYTRERAAFQQDIVDHVEKRIEQAELGVSIEPGSFKVAPPRRVAGTFDKLQTAAEQRRQQITEAEGYTNSLLAKVRGEADKIVSEARSRTNQYIQNLTSEANYFRDLLPQYKKQPNLLTTRLMVDTMQNVLTNSRSKFVFVEREDGKPRELRIQLNRLPESPGEQSGEQGQQ